MTHAAVLQLWSLARKRSALARRLAEIRGVPVASTTVQQWETRSAIPAPWIEAVAQAAAEFGHLGITAATLVAAEQQRRAAKRMLRTAAQARLRQPPPPAEG